MKKQTIAIDAMGGDHGPSEVVPGALKALELLPDISLILVGDEIILNAHLKKLHVKSHSRLRIHHASEQVLMDESPSLALRNKKDSSMRVAIDLVKSGEAQACVSAGNTGALMATARFVLKTLSGISRPAIIFEFPTMREGFTTQVLDLGANVDLSPEQLFQFAVMGSVRRAAVEHISRPTVGLLNVGEEEIKGNEVVKQTAELLTEAEEINYIGYVEGDDIWKGAAHVVVCDGFVGNIALKASEGLAKLIGQMMRVSFNKNIFTKIAGLFALPVLHGLKKSIDPTNYNGASLLGLRGIVVKSHGSAEADSYAKAIVQAAKEVDVDVPKRISAMLETVLKQQEIA